MITKKQLQKQIDELKSALLDLQNPPEFKIGDEIGGGVIFKVYPYKNNIGFRGRYYDLVYGSGINTYSETELLTTKSRLNTHKQEPKSNDDYKRELLKDIVIEIEKDSKLRIEPLEKRIADLELLIKKLKN